MTSSRTLAAAGALVATLAVAGCSFSGGTQPSGGSAGGSPTSPHASAAPEKPATPATPSTTTSPPPTTTTPPGAPSSPPASTPPPEAPASAPGQPPGQAAGTAAGTAAGPTPSQAVGTAGSQDGDPGRCTSDALSYEVPVPVVGSNGSASSTTSVVLTNAGSTPCTLYGYPGVSFVAGGDRHQVGAAADRQPDTKPARVTLAPGSRASGPLTIVANASVDAGACQPTDAVGIKVYPPGSTGWVLLDRPATVCGAPGAHQLVVGPLQAG